MQLSCYIALLLISATIAAQNSEEKCPFRDTVDLTNQTRFENGSYLYHGNLIPEDKLAYYMHRLGFRNKSEPAELHLRGCICDLTRRIYCVKMCCENGEMFNGTSLRCEKIAESLNKPTDLAIRLHNKNYQIVNLFKHFVYQVGLPCKNPEALLTETDAWDLWENGTLHINSEFAQLDTVSYCITPYRRNNSDQHILTPMSCPMKNEGTALLLLNTYGMAISVVFLIPTILVYLLLKELRSNLRGKLLICYLVSMAVGYTIISYINISQTKLGVKVCSTIGFSGYFFFISVYMWLSVLCFDIWNNFKQTNFDINSKKNRIRFLLYSVYAWGSAGLLTGIVVWAQLSDQVPDEYKPGIGVDMCWLDTRKWSAAYYFYLPNCIIIIMNIITFTNLTIRIYTTRRDLAKMTNKEKFLQENAFIIMRLFLIMGVSWCMDIISYLVRNYKDVEFIFVLTDFCNAIQGVLIFLLFVLKGNVLVLIKKRLGINVSKSPEKQPKSGTSMLTTFSKLTVPPTPTTPTIPTPTSSLS